MSDPEFGQASRGIAGFAVDDLQLGNKWRVVQANDAAHVMPITDLREHVANSECWCGPTDDDGVMVHHSMDKREEYEQGRQSS